NECPSGDTTTARSRLVRRMHNLRLALLNPRHAPVQPAVAPNPPAGATVTLTLTAVATQANEQQGNLVRLARAANAVVFAIISPYGEFGPDSARYIVVASLDARGSLRYRARATNLVGEELEAWVPIRGARATVYFEDVMLYSRLGRGERKDDEQLAAE
ncbi:hypothetical protein LTR28_005895, partial [Elasticomyces elasticus]